MYIPFFFITWISVKSVLLTKWVETARNRVLTTDFETSRRDLPEKTLPKPKASKNASNKMVQHFEEIHVTNKNSLYNTTYKDLYYFGFIFLAII